MKKINIIKETKDFENIIHKGKFIKNKYYLLYYLKDDDNKYYRFGLSVGKKISNKAVIRNKLKRRLKSIIDHHKNIYQNNQDYIIIMKRSCLEANYQELEDNFIDLINKVNRGDINEKNKK